MPNDRRSTIDSCASVENSRPTLAATQRDWLFILGGAGYTALGIAHNIAA